MFRNFVVFQCKHTALTVHCTIYTAHCTIYTGHCKIYTAHCTLLSVYTSNCTPQTAHYTLHTVCWTLHTVCCTLYTVYLHCTLHTANYKMKSEWVICITLYSVHCLLHIAHSEVHSEHCKLHIVHTKRPLMKLYSKFHVILSIVELDGSNGLTQEHRHKNPFPGPGFPELVKTISLFFSTFRFKILFPMISLILFLFFH